MGDYTPANKTLFKKLREKYGTDIEIRQHIGREPIILYKTSKTFQLCDNWLRITGNLSESEKIKF